MSTLLRNACYSATATGVRMLARQLLATAAWIVVIATSLLASDTADPTVGVREAGGSYTVVATFGVLQPASTAVAVLTDYEQIPRFMPDVRTSSVLERHGDCTVVEQEAVARLMMFSKRIHLVLEVHEASGIIWFRDRSGTSFARYEGSWTITEKEGHATIAYQLTADPSFDVPEFVLKRLLRRDATQMVERLRDEIAARSRQIASRP